jgi:hypothetical protein
MILQANKEGKMRKVFLPLAAIAGANCVLLTSGYFGWAQQFIINGLIAIWLMYYFEGSTSKRALSVLPFSLAYLGMAAYWGQLQARPHILVIGIEPICIALYNIWFSAKTKLVSSFLQVGIIALVGVFIMPALMTISSSNESVSRAAVQEILAQRSKFSRPDGTAALNNLSSDTTYLLSFSTAYCLICFQKMPQFAKLNTKLREQNSKVRLIEVFITTPATCEGDLKTFEENIMGKYDFDACIFEQREFTQVVPFQVIYRNGKVDFIGVIGFADNEILNFQNYLWYKKITNN